MSANHRVATRAIQDAVKGREAEILDELAIDWQAGHPHIICPYPTHADSSPSWRWDDKKACAFCTCIQGSHSILDVVMAKEGIDFEAAKVRAAEILGRNDLVKPSASEQHGFPPCYALKRSEVGRHDEEKEDIKGQFEVIEGGRR